MFRFSSCTFTLSEYKLKAARAYIFTTLRIPFCYTFESSVSSYYADGVETLFKIEDYEKMGAIIA
jgi:hypothetical protein